MRIGGLQKFSLIDYPGKICAIVFTQGCNFKCGYCHNPELVDPKRFSKPISEKEIFSFLKKRQGKLEAVVITGGEPILQPDLIKFIKKVKGLGFLVKLDTNGTDSRVLKRLIDKKLIDYIAMDVKAPLEKYGEVVNAKVNLDKIKESIDLIINSNIDYEFRTTIVKSQLSVDDIIEIGKLIKDAKLCVLQKFIPSKAVNPKFLKETTYSDEEFEEIKKKILVYVNKCEIR